MWRKGWISIGPLRSQSATSSWAPFCSRTATRGESEYLEPDFAYVHAELSKPKVTLTLLWDEYRRKSEELGKKPYMTTQFGDKYRKWAQTTKATIRIT